ncbi:MAG: methyltransferase domain-containing protein [Candidatus Magasanikbacteria bacterium]|jgi:ubiquinone/menaquinone biosynthesis C-methylase UbiE|nr:methyltransferase domain-containing protein [Candidatus Magasanikbacteria bacterium]MBT4314771.1 methyltransferase domain-containing protein [Candidatus Magasanikbacteria bacterium]MBT4547548.1 methyltransferase domain-containing protein [Candidatus Magasanikbacteria bacterium]MBT6819386.1 methyltransferase domain-containing protein [Candidatus Magasanikbacteria bacterium]
MPKIKILDSKEGYNLTADYYNKKSKYWDSFEKDRVLSLLGDLSGKAVLDAGAGAGRLSLRLAEKGAEVTALDVAEEILKKIKNVKIKKAIGDVENLDFPDESFDIVIATFLIVHLKDLKIFFDEAYRVLRPGGLFLVTNINQRKAPAVKTKEGLVEIDSYYHKPEKVIEELENLAFGIEKEEFVREGETWVNQIVLASK